MRYLIILKTFNTHDSINHEEATQFWVVENEWIVENKLPQFQSNMTGQKKLKPFLYPCIP